MPLRLESLKSWLLTAFALPAAFQLLESIDGRLSFGPLMERAILNFRNVSIAFWNAVGGFVELDLAGVEGILTFYLMLLLTCVRSAFQENRADDHIFKYVLEAMSQAIIVVSISTGLTGAFWESSFSIGVFFIIFLSSSRWVRRERLTPVGAFITIALLLALAYLLGTFDTTSTENRYSLPLWAALAIVVGVVNNSVGVTRLFFTRIFVFACGIFAIDFLHTQIIPAVDEFLKGAGA